MKKCANCSHEGEDSFKICPHCGTPYPAEEAAVTEEKPAATEETVAANEPAAANEAKPEGKGYDKPLMAKASAKFVESENKNHFIVNAMVLAFSIIVFICSFFAGAKVELLNVGGSSSGGATPEVGVPQNVFQLIGGAFALLDDADDEKSFLEMSEYLEESAEKLEVAMAAAELKYAADLLAAELKGDEDAYIKVMEKIMAEAMSNWDVNALKYNIYSFKVYNKLKDVNDMMGGTSSVDEGQDIIDEIGNSVSLYIGTGLGVVHAVLDIICMIASFVFMVLSLMALIRRKKPGNPFHSIFLPFSLISWSFVLLMINPLMSVTGAGATMLAMGIIFGVLMCAYKYVMVESWGSFNLMATVKYGAMFLIAMVAFFVTGANMFNVTTEGLTVGYYGSTYIDWSKTIAIFGGISEDGPGGIPIVGFFAYAWAFYIALVATLRQFMSTLLKRLYDREYDGHKLMSKAIGALICTIMMIAVVILVGKLPFIQLANKPGIAAAPIVALVFLIGWMVVNGVIAVSPEGTVEAKAKRKAEELNK